MDTPIQFQRIEQDEFKEIDFVVMGTAFNIQNDMGRLFSESVDHKELLYRLRDKFECVESEVPIEISFNGFDKIYRADSVVNSRAILELKALQQTIAKHRAQLLQYLFLTNLRFGKLINFSTPQVTGEFVSTSLNTQERKRLNFHCECFVQCDAQAATFKSLVTEMLCSLGGFLSLELYYQATEQILRGIHPVVQPIAVIINGREVGQQKTHLLSETSAFKITSLTKDVDEYRDQLKQFLSHTSLQSIQWVNLNHHDVVFETIL